MKNVRNSTLIIILLFCMIFISKCTDVMTAEAYEKEIDNPDIYFVYPYQPGEHEADFFVLRFEPGVFGPAGSSYDLVAVNYYISTDGVTTVDDTLYLGSVRRNKEGVFIGTGDLQGLEFVIAGDERYGNRRLIVYQTRLLELQKVEWAH